VATKIQILEAG